MIYNMIHLNFMSHANYLLRYPIPAADNMDLWLLRRRRLWEVALRFAAQYVDAFEVHLYPLDTRPENHPLVDFSDGVEQRNGYLALRGRLTQEALNVFLTTPVNESAGSDYHPSPFFSFRLLQQGEPFLDCGDFADVGLRLNAIQASELRKLLNTADSGAELIPSR